MEGRKIGRCRSDVIFDAVIFVILTLIFIVVAYPLWFIVISSFSDPVAVTQGKVLLWPVKFTLDGYKEVFKTKTVMQGYANSIWYTVVGVSFNLFLTIPTAYALSRKDFPLRGAVTIFYMILMFVGGGLIPTYLVVKATGLVNTVWALVVPGGISFYNVIVARTFFTTNIPGELMDAAKIDGCGNTKFFISIVLPLSGAIIAIIFLYCGVGHWNAYYSALIYITDRDKWPLQLELRNILLLNEASNAAKKTVYTAEELAEKQRREALADMMKYSLIIVSAVPVLAIYPFVQKYFVKGVMIGSVKG